MCFLISLIVHTTSLSNHCSAIAHVQSGLPQVSVQGPMLFLLLMYWKNISYPMFLPTSALTIFAMLVNQHIALVTALKQLF